MRSSTRLLALGLAMLLAPEICGAQSTLGELLDAGAKKIKPADFKRDVVQRTLIGPTNTGAQMELMYVANGSIAGKGSSPLDTASTYRMVGVGGSWAIDDAERICTAMRIEQIILPQRCQYWFKLGDAYYISDADGDRYAKVLRRSIKEGSAVAAAPSSLGELLDAGGKKVSAAEFKRDVVQRALVGPNTSGGETEIMYLSNGSVQAAGTSIHQAPLAPAIVTIGGEWKSDERERICIALRAQYGTAQVTPFECEIWFKLGDDYFVARSDSDRRSQILRRSFKR